MFSFSHITELLAIYGALLSTFLAIREFIKDQRKIKVIISCSTEITSFEEEKSIISIHAVNVGHRPIEIIKTGFIFEDGSEDFPLESSTVPSPLPRRIGDGESVAITYNLQDFECLVQGKNHQQIHLRKAFVRDAERHRYTVKLTKEEMAMLDRATIHFLQKEQYRPRSLF